MIEQVECKNKYIGHENCNLANLLLQGTVFNHSELSSIIIQSTQFATPFLQKICFIFSFEDYTGHFEIVIIYMHDSI